MSELETEPTYLDGNALAGPFAELFVVDVVHAATTCVGCGRRSRVAELRVYLNAPGAVARCPACNDPVLRMARTPEHAILDLRGTLALSVRLEPALDPPDQT